MGRSYNMHRVRCEVPGEDPARRRGIDGSRVSACVQPSALIALGTGPQTKAIEANEALGVLLVVRAAIVLERRQRRVDQRVLRAATFIVDSAIVQLEAPLAVEARMRVVEQRLQRWGQIGSAS